MKTHGNHLCRSHCTLKWAFPMTAQIRLLRVCRIFNTPKLLLIPYIPVSHFRIPTSGISIIHRVSCLMSGKLLMCTIAILIGVGHLRASVKYLKLSWIKILYDNDVVFLLTVKVWQVFTIQQKVWFILQSWVGDTLQAFLAGIWGFIDQPGWCRGLHHWQFNYSDQIHSKVAYC